MIIDVISVAGWSKEDLELAIDGRPVVSGPFSRELNGQTQHFAFVESLAWKQEQERLSRPCYLMSGRPTP